MQKPIQITILALCVALLAGMTAVIVSYRRQAQERAAHIAELSAEAKTYELELLRLRREQETQEMQLYTPEGPGAAVIAFRIGGEEQLAAAEAYGVRYGFTPVFLINVDEAELDAVIGPLADTGAELALTCGGFTGETAARLRAAQEAIEEAGAVNSRAFLLRASDDTEENRKILSRAGFTTLFLYGDTLTSDISDTGTAELNYSYVNKSSYSPAARLAALENSEQALLFAIDLKETTVTERQLDEILDLIQQEADMGHIRIGSVDAAVKTVATRLEREQARVDEFLTEQEERSARIEELEATIAEIYSHWDD